MKYLPILFILLSLSTQAQKVYLTREAVQKLTRRLTQCEQTEYELTRTRAEVYKLKSTIWKRDSLFDSVVGRLDSIIAEGEYENQELKKSYNKILDMVPIKKRKKYNLKPIK